VRPGKKWCGEPPILGMTRLAYAETAQLFVGPKGGGQNHPCPCGSGKRIRGAACIEGAPGSPGQPPRPAMKQGVHKTGTFSSSSDPFSLTTLTLQPRSECGSAVTLTAYPQGLALGLPLRCEPMDLCGLARAARGGRPFAHP
jgi:hypothetical protein